MLKEADNETMRPFLYWHIDFGHSMSEPRDPRAPGIRLRWLYLCPPELVDKIFLFSSRKVNPQKRAQVSISFPRLCLELVIRF